MLKTLEEPPSFAHLILLTSRPGEVLPTIASRCQAVRFDAPRGRRRSRRAWSARASRRRPPTRARGSASATPRGRCGWRRATGRRCAPAPRRSRAGRCAARSPRGRGWCCIEQARAAGASAGAAVEAALESELEYAIRKDHARMRREAAERAKRAARRAQTAALDRGLALVGLWLRDVACVVDGVPELVHHADRAGALREDAERGVAAAALRAGLDARGGHARGARAEPQRGARARRAGLPAGARARELSRRPRARVGRCVAHHRTGRRLKAEQSSPAAARCVAPVANLLAVGANGTRGPAGMGPPPWDPSTGAHSHARVLPGRASPTGGSMHLILAAATIAACLLATAPAAADPARRAASSCGSPTTPCCTRRRGARRSIRTARLAREHGSAWVLRRRGEWLQIPTLQNRDGARGWIRRTPLRRLTTTRLLVRVDLSQRRVRVTRGSALLLSAPVAVGAPRWPSPAGRDEHLRAHPGDAAERPEPRGLRAGGHRAADVAAACRARPTRAAG